MKNPSEQLLSRIEVDKLTSLPQILLRLIEACNDPDISFEEIAAIIKKDAALSSKMIRVANSPVYAQWGKVRDFNRLLVVLGLDTIKTIAIASSVIQFFSRFTPKRDSYLKRFWFSSLHCAHTAKTMANLSSYEFPDEAYIAGLLHKLGQLVLLNSFSDTYIPILEQTKDSDSLLAEETRQFGITQTELGAWLVDSWKADRLISDAIEFQNESAETILDAHQLVKIVNLSSKFSDPHHPDKDILFADADTLFGLAQPLLEEKLDEIGEEVRRTATAFGIQIQPGAIAESEQQATADQLDEARLNLARLVKNVALLDGTSANLRQVKGIEETLVIIQQNMNILFGLANVIFFLLDTEDKLVGQAVGNQDRLLVRLSIPLEPSRSLISDAVLQKRPQDSFTSHPDKPLNVVDRQIMRLSQREGIFVVPMLHDQQPVGAMVIGMTHMTLDALKSQMELIRLFASEAGAKIHQQINYAEEMAQIRSEQQTMFEMHARKIVHEANNPLGIINNYLHILGSKLGKDHPAKNDLNIIKEEIERVGRVLLRLPGGIQEIAHKPGLVDVNQLIIDLNDVLKASLYTAHNIEAEIRLDGTMPPIKTNRDRLKQVLINLIKNAVEAMPDGGKIGVSTLDKINVDGNEHIEITVSDNGPGMPDQILKKIFSPVTSTKGTRHSGLGLTIARNLISEIRGTISCRSSSSGTSFQILLPRVLDA